jgi:hypothetical protein
MKKFVTTALLAAFIGVGVIGCDSKSSGTGSKKVTETTPPSGGKVTKTESETIKETPPKP